MRQHCFNSPSNVMIRKFTNIVAVYLIAVFFGHFSFAIEVRVTCVQGVGNNVTRTTTIPYDVRNLPVSLDGCSLESTTLGPGPPRVDVIHQKNSFIIGIRPPFDASVKELKGFLVKIFVPGEPLNPNPDCCYVINFTKTYASSIELNEIMNAVFNISCLYKGREPSKITIFTSSYPESASVTVHNSVKTVIPVPGEIFTALQTKARSFASHISPQESTTQRNSDNSHRTTKIVVVFILSVVVSATITAAVVIVVRRKRTESLPMIHSESEG